MSMERIERIRASMAENEVGDHAFFDIGDVRWLCDEAARVQQLELLLQDIPDWETRHRERVEWESRRAALASTQREDLK